MDSGSACLAEQVSDLEAAVATNHTIGWIDVHPNYATRTEVSDILDALSSLR